MTMLSYIITIIGLLIYLGLPLPLQLFVLLLNSVTPDPIPYIDEIIMYASFIKKLITCMHILDMLEWIKEHKILAIVLGIGVIILIITFIINFCI